MCYLCRVLVYWVFVVNLWVGLFVLRVWFRDLLMVVVWVGVLWVFAVIRSLGPSVAYPWPRCRHGEVVTCRYLLKAALCLVFLSLVGVSVNCVCGAG